MINTKIIKASAGTGKTYSLSLEFLNILLTNQEVSFEEIVVITFTNKATAEIRQRIFSHLENILAKNNKGIEIINNLQKLNPNLFQTDEDFKRLAAINQQILTNKDKLNISTIDSLINQIFQGLIAPAQNFIDYTIEPNINEEYLPELFAEMFKEDNLQILERIFQEKKARNLENYKTLLEDIFHYRWLFRFINPRNQKLAQKPDFYLQKYKKIVKEIIKEILLYFKKRNFNPRDKKYYKKDFYNALSSNNITISNFESIIYHFFSSSDNILKKPLFNILNFWHGNRVLNLKADKELKERINNKIEEAQNYLANYLFYKKVIPEQNDIFHLADSLNKKYEEIKHRDKILTYRDVTYYTYSFLYNDDYSIIDDNNVLNIFYEQLSYNFRFILIDEFQDTSILQWNILYPMISESISGYGQKDYGGSIVVGDEKQSIFGWRGGERELLLKAAKFLKTKNINTLKTSYRSTPEIVKFINLLFNNEIFNRNLTTFDLEWNYQTFVSNRKNSKGYVELSIYNRQDENKNIVNKVKLYEDYLTKTLKKFLINKKMDIGKTAIIARSNRELNEIAYILNKLDIDYVLSSSASIFDYPAIKPIIQLLKFLVYKDIFELMKFLRSDIILIKPAYLKRLLINYKKHLKNDNTLRNFFSEHKSNLVIAKIKKIYNILEKEILYTTKKIIEEFAITDKFNNELDFVNINFFFEIITTFIEEYNDYAKDISGFLKFIRKNKDNEKFTQLGLQESNAVQLLTIHKSKGLEFDNVFAFFDLNPKHHHNKGLKKFYKFNESYSNINDYSFTYNHKKIISYSDKSYLIKAIKRKKYIEKLNSIYVALTRAKNNLFICAHCSNSKSLLEYLQKFSNKNETNLYLTKILFYSFYEKIKSINENLIQKNNLIKVKIGKFKTIASKYTPPKRKQISPHTNQYYNLGLTKFNNKKKEKHRIEFYKKKYFEEKNILKGNIVHYYLAQIKYNHKAYLDLALNKVISKYGSLVTKQELLNIINLVKDFIKTNQNIFSKKNWPAVFNELVIFDNKGKEYRIDRLMINKGTKNIFIIDYKTGTDYDKYQLELYEKLINNIDFVKRENFTIKKSYLQIKI